MKKLKLLFVGMLVLGFASQGYGQCTLSLSQSLGPSSVWLDTDTIEYFITLEIPAGFCNMTDVNITFYRPDDTGVDSGDVCGNSTGGTMVISGLTLTSGGGPVTINSSNDVAMSYDIDHADEDGSGNLFAYYCLRGIVQGIVPQPFQDEKPIPNTVIHPGIQISKEAEPNNICEGDETEVTYTYLVSWGESSPGIPGDIDLNDVNVTDSNCSPLVRQSDDPGNDDDVLEDNEVWVYECTAFLTEALTNTATVTAQDVLLFTQVDDQNTAEVTADNPVCGPFTGDLDPNCDDTGNTLSISATGGLPPYGYSWTSSDEVNWPITGGDGTDTITYDSGPPGSSTTFCVDINDTLDCNVKCCIEIDCEPPPGDMFCTFTQGFWGNKNGKFEGQTTKQLLDEYFAEEDTLTIGDCGNTVTLSSTSCLLKRMPAGGTPRCLEGLGDVNDTCDPCAALADWLHKGNKKGARYNNVLMGQIIALTLNMWVDPNLPDLELDLLEGKFCTQGEDPYDWQCFEGFPDLGDGMTVSDLLVLANEVLGCCEDGATVADIYTAVTLINEGFDECRTLVPCDEVCDDDIDNDCDGDIDCEDSDCPPCVI